MFNRLNSIAQQASAFGLAVIASLCMLGAVDHLFRVPAAADSLAQSVPAQVVVVTGQRIG